MDNWNPTDGSWRPTHKIIFEGRETLVMCLSGPGYTEEDWAECRRADFECHLNGTWTYQGRVFGGVVERL